MWRLKTAQDDSPLLVTLNGHVGRQTWEFDPNAGTAVERAAVEAARKEYTDNRHGCKHSSDKLLRIQMASKPRKNITIPEDDKPADIPEPVDSARVDLSMRAGLDFYQTLQMEDGHWPGDYAGPMFLMPGMVIACYVTGTMDTVLSTEHKKEMIRYLFNHQVR